MIEQKASLSSSSEANSVTPSGANNSRAESTFKQPVSAGHIHWDMKNLTWSAELRSALERGPYAEPALIPACPWLGGERVACPKFEVRGEDHSSVRVAWKADRAQEPALWVLQYQQHGKWVTKILPAEKRGLFLPSITPDALALSAVDRAGNFSSPGVLARHK